MYTSDEQLGEKANISSEKVESAFIAEKFYTLSTATARLLLLGNLPVKQFPFRLSKEAHFIAEQMSNNSNNLNGKSNALLLLGSTGTGKSTCSITRLWNKYRNYKQASQPSLDTPSLTYSPMDDALFAVDEESESSEDCSHMTTIDTLEASPKDKEPELFHQVFITSNQSSCVQAQRNFKHRI